MPDFELSKPSIQSLLIQLRIDGKPLGTATGFTAKSRRGPVLITNWHVVSGKRPENDAPFHPEGLVPNEVRIFHRRSPRLSSRIVEQIERLTSVGGGPLWYEHPTLGRRADFVALPLIQLTDVEFYPHDLENLGDNISVGVAENVSVIGFPFGIHVGPLTAIWANGFIASEPEINYNNLPIFLVDCRTREGQSGSPVIAYRPAGAVSAPGGEVHLTVTPTSRFLGIYSGRIHRESDLGMVWKVSAIKELIDAV